MRTLLLVLCLVVVSAYADDSLPWRGRIVFDTRVRVDDAPGLSGHPALHPQTIMDDDWNLFTVWADDRDNNGQFEVFFARSADTGRTWTAPNVNLSQGPSQYYVFPWLAADRTGLYVVWQAWRGGTWQLYFTKSTDLGATWTTPVQVPGITVVNSFNSGINFGPQPKLVVDSKSDPESTFLYLLWADNAPGTIRIKLARSVDLGASFADLGIVDKNTGNVNRNPFLAVDDSGWVHCAWARGTSGSNQDPHCWIGYNRSSDRGATFMASDLIVNDDFTGVYRGNPSITCAGLTGLVAVCWEDSRRAGGNGNPDVWFSQVHRDSTVFRPNQRVNWPQPDTGIRCDNYKPVIRIDPRGVMVAAWHDDPESDASYGIHLACYTDSIGRFTSARSLVQTFTGTTSGNFGNNFYPPSLFVRARINGRDTTTHFFIVWQDFGEDGTGGNVYSVHGRVITRPPWPYGWHEVRPAVPSAPSGKAVKDGAWLVMNQSSGLINVAKGNKCGDFYSYDPLDSTPTAWVTLTSWPDGTEGKQPYKGSCGVGNDAGVIYATKGANTLAFWRYDISGNAWTQLPDVPQGLSKKKVKGGTDMAYVVQGDTGWVYLLKGYKTDFMRYNTVSGRWDTLPDAPLGAKPKWDKGSWMVYDGAGTLYAHKSKYSEFWPYDIATRTWGAQLTGVPLPSGYTGKNKKCKDGSAGAYYWGGHIYALKGGNTCEFWRYDVAPDAWTEKDTMPQMGSTLKKKRVKGGGDMVTYGDWWAFFALKGNKTLELWRYVDSTPPTSPPGPGPMARPAAAPRALFSLAPSVVAGEGVDLVLGAPALAAGARLTVSDVAGRTVLALPLDRSTAGKLTLDVRALPPGRYFARVASGGNSTTRSFTVVR
jgi:hypothetical protein